MTSVTAVPAPPERAAVTAAVTAVFAAVAVLGLTHHEMWRDELEIWLIARDSATLGDLLHNMRTQGHPALWYILTFVVARFTRNPHALQVLSLAIGTAAVWIFHRYAPFSRRHRTLFCFGYFPLYDYTVISRSYGLEFLLVWTACALFPQRWDRPLRWAVALALLANTHLLGAVLAVGLALVPVFEAWDEGQARARLCRLPVLCSLLLVAAMALMTAVHVALQAANMGEAHLRSYTPTWDLAWVAAILATVSRGFLPLPNPRHAPIWGSDIFQALPVTAYAVAASVAGVAIVRFCHRTLRPRPAAQRAFLLTLAIMLTLFGVVWYGQLRHHGQIFLMFVAFLWVARCLGQPHAGATGTAPPGDAPVIAPAVATAVLVIHVLAAGVLLAADFRRPFSRGRDVAAWIDREIPPGTILAASRGYGGMAIAAWLEEPIYYPSIARWGTFFDWSAWHRALSPDEIGAIALELSGATRRPVLLILTYPVGNLSVGQEHPLDAGFRIRHVARFEGAMAPDTSYWLYLLSPP